MWLFAIFVAVPLIEIALFIQIGGAIGLWPTLLIVVLTAIAGTFLVRSQGVRVLRQLQGAVDQLQDPTEPMIHGAMILFAGALLLTPGFFTDAVGFALMIPNVRLWLYSHLKDRVVARSTVHASVHHPAAGRHARSETIDTEYEDVTGESRPGAGPSGWTRSGDH